VIVSAVNMCSVDSLMLVVLVLLLTLLRKLFLHQSVHVGRINRKVIYKLSSHFWQG